MSAPMEQRVVIGRIMGVFGVLGWVRVMSHTEPRENILYYSRWQIRRGDSWQTVRLLEGRRQGKGVVASLEGLEDRDLARALVGCDIAIDRSELPVLPDDEYYWSDLQGLRVVTVDGVDLGTLDHLFETGANDVMVVRGDRERLIPMVFDQYVKRVDMDAGVVEVDWDPEF